MLAGRHQTGKMGHIHHQVSAYLVGQGAEGGKVPETAVGRAAGDDDLRLVLLGQRHKLVHVDAVVLGADTIGDRVEPFARHVRLGAMRQMSTRSEVKAEHRVARLGKRQEDGLVRLAARVGLHVGKLAAEQRVGALDGQVFGDVDVLATTIVAFTWVTLGILVGQNGTLRLENCLGDDILRSDQFDFMLLTTELLRHGRGDRGINLGEGAMEKVGKLCAGRFGHLGFRSVKGRFLGRTYRDEMPRRHARP